MRPSTRDPNQLRDIIIQPNVNAYAEGSCLIKTGNTHVICTATVENSMPSFLMKKGQGWLTAEYSMLPRATQSRNQREAVKGKQTGRTQEIQRVIGRSLRSVLNMKKLGERQIRIDCDVIQADGGTRCAAITGGYVALAIAVYSLWKNGEIADNPLTDQIAAVSLGIYQNTPIIDLDYNEDSNAQIDALFVMAKSGSIAELQTSAEKRLFTQDEFSHLFSMAQVGAAHVYSIQNTALQNFQIP